MNIKNNEYGIDMATHFFYFLDDLTNGGCLGGSVWRFNDFSLIWHGLKELRFSDEF